MSTLIGLCPIRNFAVLEEGSLYRGAQPTYRYEYEWLKETVGIQKIINLRIESRIDETFASSIGLLLINIDVKDKGIPADGDVEKFVKAIKGESTFFHCEHGRGRTSLFSVIARISMGWSIEKALREERDKFRYNFQHPKQLNYLMNFNYNLVK